METRYIEFYDLSYKSAVTWLNNFIKDHPGLKVRATQFVFDNEGQSSILAEVSGNEDSIRLLEQERDELSNDGGRFEGWIM